MSWRAEREKGGFVRVYFRGGGDSVVKRNEFEPLCAALKRGDEWYDAVDLFGDPEMIRLSTVWKVAEATPGAIVAWDADLDEQEAHKKTHGE